MVDLTYITEQEMRELIVKEGEQAKAEGKSYIRNPLGFSGHLINTGNTNEIVTQRILERHPILSEGVIQTQI